jgi:SAM-dependent methyltransferase
MLKPNTMQEERRFERDSAIRQRQLYLDSDVLAKVESDAGYRKKVQLIEQSLRRTNPNAGWVLDIGSGTCGEDEYLATRGFKIICTDVNEVGLAISRERAERFGRPLLKYIACDGQNLPLQDDSISTVLYNESLHHMPNAAASLREAARVLEPGGGVCLLEPYAYDPWRRMSEVRDYFKGTIEKSFSIGQLRRLLRANGLQPVHVERPIYMSRTKLDRLPALHRLARSLYTRVREMAPAWLGMILMVGIKEGNRAPRAAADFHDILRCPLTQLPLSSVEGRLAALDGPRTISYPVVDGVPILIPDEATITG